MRKLPPVAREVEQRGYAELIDPGSIDPAKLKKLHNPTYVEAFLTGKGMLARSQGWPWTKQICEGVLSIQAGQLVAAENAFRDGIAANIAQGFHHAGYKNGSGYCTFNGLALVAQELPDKKIFVLDCDQHGGNGTEEFTKRLPNLLNYSINGTCFGCHGNEHSISRTLPQVTDQFDLYIRILEDAFGWIEKCRPDLVIYQAGADVHIDDPLGTLGMTTEQMFVRDQLIFQFCYKAKFPVFFVLAGGYQEPVEEKLVPLHVNTFRAAYEAYSLHRESPFISSSAQDDSLLR